MIKINSKTGLSRRQLLIAAAAGADTSFAECGPGLATPGAARRSITVLYHRRHDQHAPTLDPATQAMLGRMQATFQKLALKVQRPSPKEQSVLDSLPIGEKPAIVLEPGSGAVLLVGLTLTSLPRDGQTRVGARIDAELLIGPWVEASVVSEESAMAMRPGDAAMQAAQWRAAELAAETAADELGRKLLALSDADIDARERPVGVVDAEGRVRPGYRPATASTPPPSTITRLPAPQRRFALLVSLSNYSDLNERLGGNPRIKSLPGTAIDLKNMREMLVARGFANSDITVLSESNATAREMRRHLRMLARSTRPTDLVLVAIAAHGVPGSATISGYGMPVLNDFRPDSDPEALDFFEIPALIGLLPARQTVLIVDTCHAGGAAQQMPRLNLSSSRGLTVKTGTFAPNPQHLAGTIAETDRHCAVLVAASPDEVSVEAAPNGGLFTYTLTQALARAKGLQPLGQIFNEQVQGQVRDLSRSACRQLGCIEQNASFGFVGRGDLIQL